MIVSYFKNTKPINFIFLSFSLFLLILFSLFSVDKPFDWVSVLQLIVIMANFYLFRIITKDKLISAKDDFGILIYVLLNLAFTITFTDLYKIIANFIILIALHQLYNLKNKGVLTKKITFNVGLFIGISTILYPLSSLFLIYSYAAILLFNKMTWRLLIIPLIGFAIPFLFLFILHDLLHIDLISYHIPKISLTLPVVFYSNLVTSLILLALVLWSLVIIFNNLNVALLYYKDYHLLTVLQLFITALFVFLSPHKDGSEMIFILFPFSILLANFFPLIKKKWVAEMALGTLIIIAIVNLVSMQSILAHFISLNL